MQHLLSETGCIIKSMDSLKSDLFTKIHRLNTISKELDKLLLLPEKSRVQWLEEYSFYIEQLVDEMVQDSSLVLEAVDGDSQAVALSLEYVEQLRMVMSAVTGLLANKNQLRT